MKLDYRLTRPNLRAGLFDLDGVLTPTAQLHAVAWKSVFDDFLADWAVNTGNEFKPFDLNADYDNYVDGKPRYDGVRSFLDSRGISLEWGSESDAPDKLTVCGLGNKKDLIFASILAERGIQAYPSSVSLVKAVKEAGWRTAVVSSSKNCRAVLASAGIEDLFDRRVDEQVATTLGLRGKPAPDVYLEAASELDVDPGDAVVFEDALAGVEAGANGHFGLVIGIDRHGEREALKAHGADIVVEDLGELLVED
ncbi:MAG: beta-phosphoglucomutase family hydrolase [Actinobacteria bacterium]|jgi:beta-phosphoglucomutase family hydrolase|nr:beta-phosphoglucomutase family hydrolase [Actinomycetota bacterium]MCL6095209.1 beta-phosphoglucomutase family hydrolase [Actinomycetota bacterium]